MEQEMGRREIRKLISRVTDPTRCLEDYGWILKHKKNCNYNYWSKTFALPYPLLTTRYKDVYLRNKVKIHLGFADYYVSVWVERVLGLEHYFGSVRVPDAPKSKLIVSLALQKFAAELPKIIASAKTKPFYDETKQEQIKVVMISELAVKIDQVFDEICGTFGVKSS